MGGPLSVTLADIHMVKTEKNVTIPRKPLFSQRFVDDIYHRRKRKEDELFNGLNNFHRNIKLAIETNPCFLVLK